MNKKITYGSIDEYISTFAPEVQDILQSIRQVIKESAPDAKEKISYQMPTFELHGNLVHFAAFKHHIGFYPAPDGVEAFKEEIKPYHTSKGTIQFPIDQPIPYELIRKIVLFRAARNTEKANSKKVKKKS
ncbi:iron chaperone [Paenibacillus azoreducens]|uniref:iron chaperone n=1 Tax=Paenibacillus azoreducens TaxID=116718 RepID=UPI0039F51D76